MSKFAEWCYAIHFCNLSSFLSESLPPNAFSIEIVPSLPYWVSETIEQFNLASPHVFLSKKKKKNLAFSYFPKLELHVRRLWRNCNSQVTYVLFISRLNLSTACIPLSFWVLGLEMHFIQGFLLLNRYSTFFNSSFLL